MVEQGEFDGELSEQEGRLSLQADCWFLERSRYIGICHHLSSFVIICQQPASRTFHDVPMNRGVSTEDNRGLTSYIAPPSARYEAPSITKAAVGEQQKRQTG